MTLVTTNIAPRALVPAFQKGGPGVRREKPETEPAAHPINYTATMRDGMSRLFAQCLLYSAQQEGYVINYDDADDGIYLLQQDGKYLSVRLQNGSVSVQTVSTYARELERIIDRGEKMIIEAVGDIQVTL